jgi:uncharacterized protein (UPF0264 family)
LTAAIPDGSLPIKMTRLLVSVRNAAEAAVALRAGADLIDIKEPAKGSLGAPTNQTVEEVVTTVAGAVPVSVALGELRDLCGTSETSCGSFPWRGQPHQGSIHRLEACATTRIATEGSIAQQKGRSFRCGVAFAKLGLAGCGSLPGWQERWAEFVHGIAPPTRPVAVIYADWEIADAPEPHRVLAEAIQINCAAVLIDTFAKGRGTLLDYLSLPQLPAWIQAIQKAGKLAVLGGSLSMATVGRVAALGPDYVAVRGAVCRNGREGPLEGELVEQLARCLAPA